MGIGSFERMRGTRTPVLVWKPSKAEVFGLIEKVCPEHLDKILETEQKNRSRRK